MKEKPPKHMKHEAAKNCCFIECPLCGGLNYTWKNKAGFWEVHCHLHRDREFVLREQTLQGLKIPDLTRIRETLAARQIINKFTEEGFRRKIHE